MTKLVQAIILTVATGSLVAAPTKFDFKDPKGVNNATFKIDAPLESASGTANGITGEVTFDPEKPEAVQGKIIVDATSMHLPNPMMNGHMQSDKWMDVAKFPEITFETVSIKNAKTESNVTTADVTGKLTIKGVTKEVTVPIKMTYLKDKLSARFPKLEGDLLVLRSTFNVKRSDFGIQPGQMEEKVSDDIEVGLSIAGMAPKK